MLEDHSSPGSSRSRAGTAARCWRRSSITFRRTAWYSSVPGTDRPAPAVWHAEQAIDAAPDNGARIAGLSGAEGHVYADGAAW